MALHVLDTFPTSAQRTGPDGSTDEVAITLGTWHDDAGRALFGEVYPEVRGYPREFTHGVYVLDEDLDLQGMSQRGLLLDAGSSGVIGRLVIPPSSVESALSTLNVPIAALGPSSCPRVFHGVLEPMTPVKILDRDEVTGSVRVIDPSPMTGLSRQEGTQLPVDVWFDAAGDLDLARTRYVDGDVRRLSAGTVREWMDDNSTGPVEAARLILEDAHSGSHDNASL